MSYPPYWRWNATSYPHPNIHSWIRYATFYPYPYVHTWFREYPPVQTDILKQSIQEYHKLMEEANRILNKLSEQAFALQVLTAAQVGNKQEVDRLMGTISTTATIQTKYSPSGISITVEPKGQDQTCCKLTIYMKWGR
ncbi:hypothetical protein [Paenibacillus sp.]|jgi:hypothetical protein|uniref:hypothetical protein n=1 Tax=Paenibacillus sp. TaxID=58172 RepID=UPI00281F6036|nr:hypothetical protein [Paenibacillus sp.]MDR0271145.1 hypothetical protein [Paenibacillus sp.]